MVLNIADPFCNPAKVLSSLDSNQKQLAIHSMGQGENLVLQIVIHQNIHLHEQMPLLLAVKEDKIRTSSVRLQFKMKMMAIWNLRESKNDNRINL